MKLVGATWAFIRKPFLVKGMLHGFYASLLSLAMLAGVIYLVQHEFYEVINFGQIGLLTAIAGLTILSGVVINLVSTSLAVGKYLRLKADELYY
jgi:cell division transport system permease protein